MMRVPNFARSGNAALLRRALVLIAIYLVAIYLPANLCSTGSQVSCSLATKARTSSGDIVRE
jgi:hypothetical protein